MATLQNFGPSQFGSNEEYFRYSALYMKRKSQGLEPGEEAEFYKLEQIALSRPLGQQPASSASTPASPVPPGPNVQGVNAGSLPTAQSQQSPIPDIMKPRKTVQVPEPPPSVLNTIAANQAAKAPPIPTNFTPKPLTPEQLGLPQAPASKTGGAPFTPRGRKPPRVGANDQKEFDQIQAMLGNEYQVLPSNETVGGVRRLAVRRVADNEVLAIDVGIHRNVNGLGTVFTAGDLTDTDKGAAILGPYQIGRYNEKNAPDTRVSFQGYTGHQNLQMRIVNAFWAKDSGMVETAQKGWSYALAGHFDMPAVTRVPGNAPEQVRREAMRKVPFLMGAANPKDKLAPYMSEQIESEYERRISHFVGPVSNLPGEQLSWSKLRSEFYFPEKGGANLVPYADIVRTEYVGRPGEQSVMTSYGQVSATALKAKRSVGYGGTEVYPYMKTLNDQGREIFQRQQPAELTPENQQQPYTYLSAVYPGSSERMAAEARNVLFTPVPGIPGSHLLMENPNANRPDAYGNEANLREELPGANILDILSGNQKVTFSNQVGEYFPLGERPIQVGSFTKGDETFPVSMQKGTAPIAPSRQWMEVPGFIDPKTGKGVASEEFGVSTAPYLPALREKTGIQDIRRGTVSTINLGMGGFANFVGGNRFFDVKALPSPTGETFKVNYGGTSMDIDEVGGEAKGAQVAFAFMSRRNAQQLQGIFGDWASNVGTREAQELNEYVQKTFLSPEAGRGAVVDYEKVAAKYRSLTARNQPDQRFMGSGFGFLQEIFNRQFIDVDTNTPEGALRNVRNFQLYQGGYVGSQNVSMPVDPEQYDMLRGHAIRAIQRTTPDMSEEAAGQLFEKHFQLGGTKPNDIVVNALKSLNQGTAMQMTFPTAERSFAANIAMPMTAKMIGEGQVNMEAQLAMAENYPEFARELGIAVQQSGRISPVQGAALNLAGFASFTKSAMEGSPVMPSSSQTLSEEQLLKIRELGALKDLSNEDFLTRMGEAVGDQSNYIRFGKTEAILPSIDAIKQLSYKKYDEEVGPLLGRYRSAAEKLVQEELSYAEPINYNPLQAGVEAVTPLFKHAERLFQGKGEVAKHLFSKEPQFSITTGFAGSLAFRGNEIYFPQEIQKHMLGGAGLRGEELLRNLSIFDDENGIPALSLRHPQMGMKLLPSMLGGESMLRRAYGDVRANRIMSNPRMWGVSLTGQALAQKDIGDFDWDMLTASAGLKIVTGEETYLDRSGNEQVRRKRDVVPLSPEKLEELHQMSMEDLAREEALSFPNKEQRDRSNAIVGSFEDYFKSVQGDKVTQKDIMKSAMSEEKYGWRTIQDVGKRAMEIKRATTIGMGSPYGVWRQQMVGAALSGASLSSQGSSQADYTLGLDMWKLGQEAGGARLPAALSKFYAGMKQIKDDNGVVQGEEAYMGYSTNVKDDNDIAEYNRLYLKDIGMGGVETFLSKLVTHATAPIQEEGKDPMYIRGAQQIASLFAPEEDREMLQRKLERVDPSKYGTTVSAYHRSLYNRDLGPGEYDKRLMSSIPILLSSGARAMSKAQQMGERGVQAQASLAQFGQVLGSDLTNTWRVGAGFHDILYRMPQGVPSANLLRGGVAGTKNEIIQGFMKRVLGEMGIPIDAPEVNYSLVTETPVAQQAQQPGLPVTPGSATGIGDVLGAIDRDIAALTPEEEQEKKQLSQSGSLTPEKIQRFNQLRAKEAGTTVDDLQKAPEASFDVDWQKTDEIGWQEQSHRMAEAAASRGVDVGDLGGGGGRGSGGGGTGGGGTGGGGGGRQGGYGNAPMSGRQANLAVQRAYTNLKRFQARVPGLMEDVRQFLGVSTDNTEPLFKILGERLAADPVGTVTSMQPKLARELKRMGTLSDIHARGSAALSRSDYATDLDVKRILGDPNLRYAVNEMGGIGKSFAGPEMGMNPYLIGQAQSMPFAQGFEELYQGAGEQGLLDQWAFTQGEFQQRSQALLSGPNAARNRQLLNQAIKLKSKFTGEKAEMLPAGVQQLGHLGEAIKTLDPDLLKETRRGKGEVVVPTEKIEELNRLYEKQAEIATKLTKAHDDGNKAQEKRLTIEKAQTDLEVRKAEGANYLAALRGTHQEMRQQFVTEGLDYTGYKKMRSIGKEISTLEMEQQQQISEEGVGPYGRAARRLLGGFGLMYARSVFGFATGGLGFGQQERAGLEANISQGAYQALGIARTPYNQNLALQNQIALSGQSTNPITGLSQLSAQNPGLRDVYNMGVAGIGAWGFSQYAASTMPAGDVWGKRLTQASPYLGLAAMGLSVGAEMSSRSQDPSGMAWRMTAGGIPSPLDYATTGFMSIFDKGGAQEVGRQAQIYRATSNAFDRGTSFEELMRTRNVMPGTESQLGDRGDYYQAAVRELLQRTPSLSQEAASRTAGWLQTYAPGLNLNDSRIDAVAADYQMGGRAGTYAQQMMLMGGMAPGSVYKPGQDRIAPLAKLQMDLAGMSLDQGQQALIEQGFGRGAQVSGINELAPRYQQAYGRSRSNTANIVDYWSRLGALSEGQFGAYRTQAEAAVLAKQANLSGVADPTLAGVEGITDKYQLATMTAQAQGQAQRAQMRMSYAQNQMQQSYQFGNLQLGNQLYNKMTNVTPGTEWAWNSAFSMDPRMMGYMGTQGVNWNQQPGIGLLGGGQISAAYYNQQDVGLNGQLTGLGYGRTSFAQAGGFSASQMTSRIFGANWQNNANFSQGAIRAGLSGQSLMAPITLPNGQVISEVGGTMGMELYQDQLQYQHQMAEIGRANRGRELQYAFTTGIGLSAFNGTQDPRTGKPFGNLGATGGFWGLEDRGRQQGYAQQEWQFGFQQRQMQLGTRQFNENMGMQIYQSNLQRGWTREDWGYQDMTRNMQWGWKQEDFQEENRFMTGRQRRLNERQMRRDTTMHNLEEGQIEKGRGRQEELWKLEDERFKIQRKQYNENLQMQEESLKKQREFFEERKKLEAEQVKLQRAYFVLQNKLQEESAQAAAGYAKENMKLRQTFTQLQIETELSRGQLNLIREDGFENLREALLALDPVLSRIIETIGGDTGGSGGTSYPTSSIPTIPSSNGGTNIYNSYETAGQLGGKSAMVDSYMQNSILTTKAREASMEGASSQLSSFIPMAGKSAGGSRPGTINLYLGNELLRTFVIDSVNQDLQA